MTNAFVITVGAALGDNLIQNAGFEHAAAWNFVDTAYADRASHAGKAARIRAAASHSRFEITALGLRFSV